MRIFKGRTLGGSVSFRIDAVFVDIYVYVFLNLFDWELWSKWLTTWGEGYQIHGPYGQAGPLFFEIEIGHYTRTPGDPK